MISLCFAICGSGGDAHAFTYSKRLKKREWYVSAGIGARYFTHYNRIRKLSTPPESISGEFQFVASFRRAIAMYGYAATSVAKSDALMVGGGLKLPFLTLSSSKGALVGGVNLFLVADGGYYSLQAPVAPEAYEPTGFMFRYGGGVGWNIGNSRLYIDSSMMVTDMNDNFFIAPYVGVGMNF
jgi:hypothetical protein